MRAWGHDMTWWARTAQKSGSRLLPHAAVPVWLWPACKDQAMAPDENLAPEAPWMIFEPGTASTVHPVSSAQREKKGGWLSGAKP